MNFEVYLPIGREPNWLCKDIRKLIQHGTKFLLPYSLRPSRGEAGAVQFPINKGQAQIRKRIALHLGTRNLPLMAARAAAVDGVEINRKECISRCGAEHLGQMRRASFRECCIEMMAASMHVSIE